ncbi:MAG: DNA-processing protein DprA [Coriobacteriales bacterium]|jgi:DNA processing protein|nr:DNA-processing protein DprA [Coriobacteriales bacterium]
MKGEAVMLGERFEVRRDDPSYPGFLRAIDDPPPCLYAIGDLAALKRPALAIVGARKATPYGLSCAHRFAKRAALGEVAVVSGGAIGCDQAAHRGALEGGGCTIVVLGCGADVLYPAKARPLFNEVLERGGVLVSEAPWGAPPSRWGFVRRNRIIAALAHATLIVEAGLPSGTFSTADATLAQGKDVLAVPGSIFSKESRGSNRLIAQGAVPIVDDLSFEDALNATFGCFRYALPAQGPGTTGVGGGEGEGWDQRALSALTASPMRPDELVGVCGGDVIAVIRNLSQLEMAGRIERLRDGRYTTRQR